VQHSQVQTRQQAERGTEIERLKRKGTVIVPFLVILFFAFLFPSQSLAADKKAKRPAEVHPAPVAAPPIDVNDVNLNTQFEAAESLLKKGKSDEAARLFQAVYNYTRDTLTLLKCVKGAYEKALSGAGIDQAKKEDLFLKLERVSSLNVRYTDIKGETAYHLGEIYKAKSNPEQARKYLLEACQTVPFSLESSSTWMKAKNLLLILSNLEGEF
jgi:hypothetical protein